MLAFALAASLAADWPLTTPEKTNYEATSTYQDVVTYLETLEKLGAPMKVTWIGESTEGRKIPLCIVSDPPVSSAREARAQGKLVVYIQGNIHAGEVEGKEAAQIILRRLGQNKGLGGWLKKMVLLVNPIYNADGNEKWGPVEKNRPEQDGPKVVGLRPNGQGFDLNRDCIKAESPEMRAALDHIFKPWDPDAVLDLHTTDGTRHGFDLTYAPPLNPNTDKAILDYSREKLLPAIRRESVAKYGKDLFDYGNAARGATPRWDSFEPFGRYVTNYAGLCNRIGILSEAATYIPFKDRIDGTDHFVTAILDHFTHDASAILKMRKSFKLPAELAVRFETALGRTEDVPLEKLAPGEQRPLSGRPKELEKIKMPVYDRFVATKTARVPKAYLVPGSQTETIRLLMRHGIDMKRVSKEESIKGSAFTISSAVQARQAFQGHKLITLEGTFADTTVTAHPGDYLVPTAQRLGGLAFIILEPESQDGAAAWGFLGEDLKGQYPISKAW
jgi:hypothetical protein